MDENNTALMDKAQWKEHLKEEKREFCRTTRLAREKFEKDNCGGYCLVYPFVSYEEEDMISAMIEKQSEASEKEEEALEGLESEL